MVKNECYFKACTHWRKVIIQSQHATCPGSVFIDSGSPSPPLTEGAVLHNTQLSQGVRNCIGRNEFLETGQSVEMRLCVLPAMWPVGRHAASSGPFNRKLTREWGADPSCPFLVKIMPISSTSRAESRLLQATLILCSFSVLWQGL